MFIYGNVDRPLAFLFIYYFQLPYMIIKRYQGHCSLPEFWKYNLSIKYMLELYYEIRGIIIVKNK